MFMKVYACSMFIHEAGPSITSSIVPGVCTIDVQGSVSVTSTQTSWLLKAVGVRWKRRQSINMLLCGPKITDFLTYFILSVYSTVMTSCSVGSRVYCCSLVMFVVLSSLVWQSKRMTTMHYCLFCRYRPTNRVGRLRMSGSSAISVVP